MASCTPIGTPRNLLAKEGTNLSLELDEFEEEARLAQVKKLPSPSAHIDANRPFTMDKLVPKSNEDITRMILGKAGSKEEKTKQPKVAPEVARYNQRMRRRMEEDYRRMLLQTERRE